jgi:hypothetical protein
MLRLSAAAARMIDACCATNSFRRALSSSVQGPLAKPTMLSVSLRGLEPARSPTFNGSSTSILGHARTSDIRTSAHRYQTRFDSCQHHAALTLGAVRSEVLWFGASTGDAPLLDQGKHNTLGHHSQAPNTAEDRADGSIMHQNDCPVCALVDLTGFEFGQRRS